MKVALVGQPNSGKSTIFNAVAGYRSLTSNFAGTTVEYTRGQARVNGNVLELIDLPGLYSLTPTSAVEEVSRDYLLGGNWDVIVNVLDASQLARSLELTLELLDLESPSVVCLNMMDEAARKGMTIDTKALQTALGVPVVEAIGSRGQGINETFRVAQEVAQAGRRPRAFIYAPEAEEMVEGLARKIAEREESEVRSQESEVRSQETPVGSQETGVRRSGEAYPSALLLTAERADLGASAAGGKIDPARGGDKPSKSKAFRGLSCSTGCCSAACSGHPARVGGRHAPLPDPPPADSYGSKGKDSMQQGGVPVPSLAPNSPNVAAQTAGRLVVLAPPSNLEAGQAESSISNLTFQIENPKSPKPSFPPARFRALQLVQSDPRRVREEFGNPAECAKPDILDTGPRTPNPGLSSPDSRLLTPDSSLVALDSGLRTPDFGPALVELAQAGIATRTGLPADAAISAARHAACLTLFERVARVARPRTDWREHLDRLAMHHFWGYVVLAGVFLGFFRLIFDVGKLGEDRILKVFDAIVAAMAQHMNAQGAVFAGAKGAVLGTAGAVAIVLPYLLPFLAGLAILEDIGYLSRVGYLMDAAMHRLGLHGTATLPVLVGYGCSVPAVMGTRILSSRRDRFITAVLAVLVPCSARMTVIFALVGFYLGPNYALGIYVLNIVVVAVAGHILARLWPEVSPGMLMEVPAYRVPGPRVVALKTWWRLREFVLVAFPLLVIGSVVLSLVDYYGWQHGINAALSPFTALLGLPRSVGLTLIFGVLRKELSLLMLMQALGTSHVLGVMTAGQILIFTLFVTFYLPCMATLASMMRELGWRLTLAASSALLVLAIVVSLTARAVLHILG